MCLLTLPLAFAFAACGKSPEPTPELPPAPTPTVTSVTVSPKTHTFTAAGTLQMSATVAITNGAAQTVTWHSSNANVATISASGLVTAALNGTTTITATSTADTTKHDTATITVNIAGAPAAPAVTSVTVSPKTATLTELNATVTIVASVVASNGTAQTVEWASSHPAVATVSNAGVVTALTSGTTTITATSTVDDSKFDTAEITVALPTSLELFMSAISANNFYTEETVTSVWTEEGQQNTDEYIRRSYYYVAQDGTEWVKAVNICDDNHPYVDSLRGQVEWIDMTNSIRYEQYEANGTWHKEAIADSDNGPGMSELFVMLESSWVAVDGGYEIIIDNLDGDNPVKALATYYGMTKVTLNITVSNGVVTAGIMKTFIGNTEAPMGFNLQDMGKVDLATELADLADAFENA